MMFLVPAPARPGKVREIAVQRDKHAQTINACVLSIEVTLLSQVTH